MANTLAVLNPEASLARVDRITSGEEKAEVAVRAPGAVVETKDLYDIARLILEGWIKGTIELTPSGYGYKQFDPAEFLVGMVRRAEQHREISPKQFAAFAGLAKRQKTSYIAGDPLGAIEAPGDQRLRGLDDEQGFHLTATSVSTKVVIFCPEVNADPSAFKDIATLLMPFEELEVANQGTPA